MTTETKISNLLSKLDTLERETTVNLASTKWRDILKILNQIGRQTSPQG